MKRLITIDNGNTNTTVGIFENRKLIDVIALADYKKLDSDFILISSVGPKLPLSPSYDLHKHRSETHFFDMPVHYAKTLGDDRLIAAYGIYKNLKDNEIHLIIDAGTFVTCDVISSKGFLGGHILPGIERFLSAYAVSEKLPEYTAQDFISFNSNSRFPQTTNDAILSASRIYFKETIGAMIKAASPSKITWTGGSAKELKNLISSEVPSELGHHLVHLALDLLHQQCNPQA